MKGKILTGMGILAIILIAAFFANSGSLLSIVDREGCEFATPHFGQIQCNDGSVAKMVEGTDYTVLRVNMQGQQDPAGKFLGIEGFTCLGSTCTVYLPSITCPGGWFDQQPQYQIAIDNSIVCGLNAQGSSTCTGPIDFYGEPRSKPQTVSIVASCKDFIAGNVFPAAWDFDIRQTNEELYYYASSISGGVKLSNTIGCYRNDLIPYFQAEQPLNGLSDLPAAQVPVGATDWSQFPNQLNYRESYLFLDKWDLIQTGLDIKYYNNEPVHCDNLNKRLVKYDRVNTDFGCYRTPSGEVIDKSSDPKFCCNTGDCYSFGTGWTCNQQTFQCQYGGSDVPCNSHYECGSMEECVVDGSNFFIKGWRCVENANSPKYGFCEYQTDREVECCPSYCTQFGQYCNYDTGCETVIRNCPAGSCCLSGGPYTARSCSDLGQPGDLCCPTAAGSFIGECKEQCVSTCGDGQCQGTETQQNCPEDCAPIKWEIMIVVLLAALFAAVGYISRSKLGAVMGLLIGIVIGSIIYWFTQLPFWAQLLLQVGGGILGIGLLYLIVAGVLPLVLAIVFHKILGRD